MAKDSVYVSLHQNFGTKASQLEEHQHIPTESDMSRVNGAPPQEGSVALIGVEAIRAYPSTCTTKSIRPK